MPSDPPAAVEASPSPYDVTPSPSVKDLHSPNTNNKGEQKQDRDEDEEDEEDEEDHFSHRRLTGDSGIEVCRCHVRRGEEELQKGRLDEGKGEGAVQEVGEDCPRSKLSVQSSVLDPCEEVPSSPTVIYKADEAVITVESS